MTTAHRHHQAGQEESKRLMQEINELRLNSILSMEMFNGPNSATIELLVKSYKALSEENERLQGEIEAANEFICKKCFLRSKHVETLSDW